MEDLKTFAAPHLTLDVPAEWIDASTYVIGGPVVEGFRTSLVITRNPKPLETNLDTYVDIALTDLGKLKEFQLIGREPVVMGGCPATCIDYQWTQEPSQPLRQRQWHVWVKGQVYSITLTALPKGFDSVKGLYAEVLATFKPRSWGAPT